MTDTMAQLSKKELREHPTGHKGILASLQAVAAAIREGRLHEDVISWSGHKLVESGSPSGNLSRGKALFDAFAKQYAYMHDQRGVERIAGAHLTLGDGNGKRPLLPGGDCDDAVVAYGSACEAAGIPTAVVGAAYDPERNISHVLLLVSDGNGKWVYADPSAKGYQFGQYKTPTRELIVDVLTGEVLCDDTMCSPKMAGRILDDDAAGSRFLALHGIETFQIEGPSIGLPSLGTLQGLGSVEDLGPQDREYLDSIVKTLTETLESMQGSFKVAQEVISSLGMPLLGEEKNPIFGPFEYQRAVNLERMLLIGINAFEGVLSGQRKVGLVEGVFGVDLLVEQLPSDELYVGFDLKSRMVELFNSANKPVNVQGSLAGFPVLGVAIAVAVISVAISGASIADSMASAQKAIAAAQQAANQKEYELVKAGKVADLERVYEARKKLMREQSKVTPGGQVNQAAQGVARVFEVIGYVALGGFVLWGANKAFRSMKLSTNDLTVSKVVTMIVAQPWRYGEKEEVVFRCSALRSCRRRQEEVSHMGLYLRQGCYNLHLGWQSSLRRPPQQPSRR